jgi:hypothetical protein
MSRFPPIPPEHTTVIGQDYFRFECNNAMNAMGTIDGEPGFPLPLITDENKTSTGESKIAAIVTLAN